MHTPVLKEKVLEYLQPKPNENFIDCTAGAGGHTFSLAEKITPKGKVFALDWDAENIKLLKQEVQRRKLQSRVLLWHESFGEIQRIVKENKLSSIAGILFDFGFSSDQLDRGRGFSFLKNENLDMRYSAENPVTAEKLLNFSSRTELEDILKEYGEEQFAKQIAHGIVENRKTKPIQKTFQLVQIVEHATPKSYQRKKIHPATKTFQALRIATNNELENIQKGLQGASAVLQSKGIIAAISFHSLEDRIVKEFFKQQRQLQILTKKPIVASVQEIKNNPRARSAKLRAATKI